MTEPAPQSPDQLTTYERTSVEKRKKLQRAQLDALKKGTK